jgi:diguanylate cyclase (GGDEF)-like protein
MTLDVPTLFTCIMIAEFAGSVILLVFYLFWPGRSVACARSLAFWSTGMFLAGCGTVLFALRGAVPDLLSIVAANFLLILGTGLRRSGVAVFLERNSHVWLFATVALGWIVLYQFPEFRDNLLARVNYVQSIMILSALWVVWMAFFENREKFYSVRMLGMTTFVEAAGFMWYTVNQNILLLPSFQSSFSQDFMSVYLLIIMFSIIMTIVLPASMVIERSMHGFREQALQDELTGLPNRRAFLNDAEGWISANPSPAGMYSLILFDLDQFKTVNERFNQAMGDALLQLFARILKDTLAEDAVPGRVGGAEFAVFLPLGNKELAHLTAQRICRRFGLECQEASGGRLFVTASVGLVSASVSTPLERAMEAAEGGLHRAKKQGCAQIVTVDLAPNGRLIKDAKRAGFSVLRKKAA